MTTIELTDEQRQAVQSGEAVRVPAPEIGEDVVLLRAGRYESIRGLLEKGAGGGEKGENLGIPAGILRSQQAFWRDLPELLSRKKFRGQWVCYAGDERIGIGPDQEPLIRECLRRGIPNDQYYLTRIRERELPPWEPEEVEPLGLHPMDDSPCH